MLWALGARPLPRRTVGYVAGAIACLMFGFLFSVIGRVASIVAFVDLAVAVVAAGAILAVLAIYRAYRG